jgi:hypothetical protein
MAKAVIHITREEYNKLTTREKLTRIARFVNLLLTLEDEPPIQLEKDIIYKLYKYLLKEDFLYMTEDQKLLFKKYIFEGK